MKLPLLALVFVSALCRSTLAAVQEFNDASANEMLRAAEQSVSKLPGFPKSYEVEYTFTLPYTSIFSPAPVKYPVRMWVDAEDDENVKIRVDDHDGMNKKITTKDIEYVVNPRISTVMCTKQKPKPDDHLHRVYGKERGLPHDMKNWTYIGMAVHESQPCKAYRLEETFFERTAYYTLYVDMEGAPLSLSAIGQNYFTGAHFDEYLAYFTKYVPGVPNASVFEPPEECNGKWWNELHPDERLENRPILFQMDFLIPRIVQGHPEYDEWLVNNGLQHASALHYAERLKIFLRNKEHVERHNARNDVTYSLELNQFADWADEEFMALKTGNTCTLHGTELRDLWLLGHLQETKEVEDMIRDNAVYFMDTENDEVPESFSWYGTPADGIVKDQAVCGSCWAFAATEAMKGAWYVATNESASLSEQQMVDCSWNYFNYACEGGFISLAILYVIKNGGISSEFAYGYKGVDDYCNMNASPFAKFSDVGIAGKFQPEIVKKALIKHGPLGISMDAGHLDFRFYKSGVFIQPECKANQTNHAVSLIGYGNEGGRNYWLIKNSWSTFWGDKGYIKMDAEEFDCGVTYRPVYAVADEVAAAKRREEIRMRQT